jgi:hypothetical protein
LLFRKEQWENLPLLSPSDYFEKLGATW